MIYRSEIDITIIHLTAGHEKTIIETATKLFIKT